MTVHVAGSFEKVSRGLINLFAITVLRDVLGEKGSARLYLMGYL